MAGARRYFCVRLGIHYKRGQDRGEYLIRAVSIEEEEEDPVGKRKRRTK